jgi:uncharacterized Zn-finger protein
LFPWPIGPIAHIRPLRAATWIEHDTSSNAGKLKYLAEQRRATTDNEDNIFMETNPTQNVGSGLSRPPPITMASIDVGQRLSKFRNDRGVPEIRIGVREFKCVGISPPQDHPHVYINMGEADTILCPYCATRFRFDPRLTASDADPPDSFYADHKQSAQRGGTGQAQSLS